MITRLDCTRNSFAAALLCGLGALTTSATAQNLYKERQSKGSSIQDLTARAIGDILSIVVMERHKITNEDRVERSNTSSLSAQLEAFTLSEKTFKTNVLPQVDVRQDRSFEGDARQEKDSTFEARIAVMVIDVMPNGNLVLAGSRMVQIDDETKTMRISGVVRPIDISSTNSISSSLVAEARVSMSGDGGNTRATTRGPVGTLFDTLVWAAWPF